MKIRIVLSALLVAAVILVAACGGKGALHAAQASKDPKVQQEEKQAQVIVQRCVSKANFLTHAGRKQVWTCIAPPGKEAAMQKCAEAAVSKNGFLTHKARQRSLEGVAVCVETIR